jgi:transposase
MKAYSLDFREKIIQVYENEEISQRELAKRFCVAKSFIQKLIKQYRETGEIGAKPFAGGVKLKLTGSQLVSLAEVIEANNDATLEELCKLFQEKTGVALSRATMGRMTQRLKMTVKKNIIATARKVRTQDVRRTPSHHVDTQTDRVACEFDF